MTDTGADLAFMRRALDLAAQQLGKVAPNPSVGCVLVRAGVIVGEGATGNGGRPHAEEIAIAQAGSKSHGAIAYVTLEPCAARSTGVASCASLLLAAKVARIVIACEEPNPLSARGAELLRANGVSVEIGVLREDAAHLNRGFFKRIRTGRPWVAIDADASSYDTHVDVLECETPELALDRLGGEGFTRVRLTPGTPLAQAFLDRGLVDEA
jgi:diaminohydroxyphosphoribosylaminopyrimidine deaminase/5-amino-6-(5-phosphoribosylamino)uracil reductase